MIHGDQYRRVDFNIGDLAMHWRNNSEHPEEGTLCLCEYSDGGYDPLKAACSGWLDLDFGAYDNEEITKWCPLDEIAEELNRLETSGESTMNELTQIELHLGAANDDLMSLCEEITGEDLRSVAAKDAIRRIDFYLPTVLGYIRHIKHRKDNAIH